MTSTNHHLKMTGISLAFPGVQALKQVSFEVKSGEIHALVGANGAGKSTLMKVLSGAETADEGTIRLDGKELSITSPRDAKQIGIDLVQQEVDVALVPYLTVAENICLDLLTDGTMTGFVSQRRYIQRAKEALATLQADISVKTRVEELRLAEKQLVLIARALVQERRFLILDEPTAPLSQAETSHLFSVVRRLAERGLGIIFISHRLQELYEICDSISVMRDGQLISRHLLTDITKEAVVEQMLGRQLTSVAKTSRVNATNVLTVESATNADVHDISLTVQAGEVVGIAGLVGAGKTELCKALFGDRPFQEGEVRIGGKAHRLRDPQAAIQAGIGLVPEERRKEGILVADSVAENLTAAAAHDFVNRWGLMDRRKEANQASKWVKELGIKVADVKQEVGQLSGGNQQKVAIGKWLLTDVSVLVLDEPTKGVDVGAKQDIYRLIDGLAQQQKGILYATSEWDELLTVTDRIYVMFDGRIVHETKTADTSEETLLWYATGGGQR
ncbi:MULTISPECIES: sugar ABC transporter ATP-binding protein [unclassified Exiguobacterium]|uniref:sugar ABC transporter ATP-binding protein n=2 Tax=Bacillales Family XII. Incertae Sedis TaxID=539742 RepID=UPI000493E7A3|nr:MULTISPECIES: sugar ABC transporter ATP-binding protein [unclassified Exiguobacterium]HCD59053.1 sugar ABC transporter ATP-binding protein [Exiguobacterium sp.]